MYYANSGNSYTGLCGDAKILSMVRRATTISALTPQVAAYANTDIGDWDEEACHASGNQYAIWVPLKESISSAATAAWCIDSTDNGSRRVSGAGLTLGSGIYVCP